MPILDFECVKCRFKFERITTSIKQEADPTCEKCGKPAERRFGVPNLGTQAVFLRGAKEGAGCFETSDDKVRKAYLDPAKKAGVAINGRTYQGGLARFPGDPEAWVGSMDEAKAVLRRRGWGSEQLGVKAVEREPEPSIPIADDIVDRELGRMVATGEIAPHEVEKKRYDVAERLSPPNKKGQYVAPKHRKKAKVKP